MPPEFSYLDALLADMLGLALHRAARVPTPAEPADDAWEQETDLFCYRFARTQEAELPSPEIAAALIPRLRIARVFASLAVSALDQKARLEGREATEREILEWILVGLWHGSWKSRWLAGEFEL